jgi:CRISPR system Cascade subunit CasE
MYISMIRLEPNGNKTWDIIKDCYEMHKDILSAFPDYNGNVREKLNILYKVIKIKEKINILIKSDIEPDWDKSRIYKNMQHESKNMSGIKDKITNGDIFQFDIDVCPSKKIKTGSKNSKRIFLYKREDQTEWLERKGEQNGFEVFHIEQIDIDEPETLYGRKKDVFFYKTKMTGVLKVIDKDKFINALYKGIGSEKAFGCGLLTIKKMRCNL